MVHSLDYMNILALAVFAAVTVYVSERNCALSFPCCGDENRSVVNGSSVGLLSHLLDIVFKTSDTC